MGHIPYVVLCFLLVVSTINSFEYCQGRKLDHFYGGSISYSVSYDPVTDISKAHLDILTGWKLGKGPCGPHCTKHNVGERTSLNRQAIEAKQPEYFGKWTTEYYRLRFINQTSTEGFSEKVIAVNEKEQWEQEWATMTIPLDKGVQGEDIVFSGCSWPNLTLQGSHMQWHVQAKILQGIRNDTQRPNSSPKTYVKPYYKFQLNQVNKMAIAAVDPDGDYIKCSKSQFVEMGQMHNAQGLAITEDCLLSLNTSDSLGYRDDSWVSVSISLRDYNKRFMTIGTDELQPYSYSLSGTTVQFLVHVVDQIYQPEFVSPTKPSNHMFYLYAGATWTTSVYATASVNTTIDEFVIVGRSQESITKSAIKDDTSRPLTKYLELSWSPDTSDVGNHIVCVSVIDNTKTDSSADKCFIIEVTDDVFSNYMLSRPYFIDVPSFDQEMTCPMDATCIFPVYIKSAVEIKDIRITQHYVDEATHGGITNTSHGSDMLYKTDIAFQHSVYGSYKLCFIATDINGMSSEETCIQTKIQPPDPCRENKCKNSAVCSISDYDPLDYVCDCKHDTFGKYCERLPNYCEPMPCVHGKCYSLQLQNFQFYCYCDNGFTGNKCDVDMNACPHGQCNGTTADGGAPNIVG